VTRLTDVCAVIVLLTATRDKVAWQRWYDDDLGCLMQSEKDGSAVQDPFVNWKRTCDDFPGQVVPARLLEGHGK
jgi:hypothetical protein